MIILGRFPPDSSCGKRTVEFEGCLAAIGIPVVILLVASYPARRELRAGYEAILLVASLCGLS